MSTLKIISHSFPASLERELLGKGGRLQIAANSYVTTDIDATNNNGKISLIFAHAAGFHKELWNPIIKILHERRYKWNGGDMWTLDCSNHGDSAMLNQDILPDSYILQLIDEAKIQNPIIGIGHSLGEIIRPGTFMGIFTIEPLIMPNNALNLGAQEMEVKRRHDRWQNR
ncbi:17353_t:CDS:2 [Racocetra fulgida]|uniref:17353_t:CDS:1 n=1 Tax=Racocetra fulgida TaxID=60492 RepID=A0A9N8VMA4_9GLOM|nr:17353_t:CDS:2 [Racocetra fulgida]